MKVALEKESSQQQVVCEPFRTQFSLYAYYLVLSTHFSFKNLFLGHNHENNGDIQKFLLQPREKKNNIFLEDKLFMNYCM